MNAGLCDDCRNARRITSARGSVFLRCELHEHDPAFAKYPRLPVLQCRGFRKTSTPPGPADGG